MATKYGNVKQQPPPPKTKAASTGSKEVYVSGVPGTMRHVVDVRDGVTDSETRCGNRVGGTAPAVVAGRKCVVCFNPEPWRTSAYSWCHPCRTYHLKDDHLSDGADGTS